MPRSSESEVLVPGMPSTTSTLPFLPISLTSQSPIFLPVDDEVGRRIHRIGRRHVADHRERRHALVIGVFDGLVEGGRVRAADDQRVDAAIDELAHLLDLHGILRGWTA